jgi:hypothetical protein
LVQSLVKKLKCTPDVHPTVISNWNNKKAVHETRANGLIAPKLGLPNISGEVVN